MVVDYDLHSVFPWGRSFRDYVRMFDLSPGTATSGPNTNHPRTSDACE